jgi:adenosylcobinamide kinase/adenosylcobinamide-phosphate guanylyltransferase
MKYLILGGARSGKSSYAESLATNIESLLKSVVYVATATANDSEMKHRIEHHQNTRPSHWRLVEEPYYLSKVVEDNNSEKCILLIDCMTLYVTNWLCRDKKLELWQQEKNQFLKALAFSKATIFIVSNEVGSGIIPLGELTRSFVDEAGWLNQALGKISQQVILVVAGLPLSLKNDDGRV